MNGGTANDVAVSEGDIATAIFHATRLLAIRSLATPRLDAEVLLACALGVAREALIIRSQEALLPEPAGVFASLLARRLAGEPVAYITGIKEFWGMPFAVSPAVLIPRPDTETLVEALLEALRASQAAGANAEQSIPTDTGDDYDKRAGANTGRDCGQNCGKAAGQGLGIAQQCSAASRFSPVRRLSATPPSLDTSGIGKNNPTAAWSILEIGVGSGAIACALAKELPSYHIVATDISPDALAMAQKNAEALGLAERIQFILGDLFAGISRRFEAVVANLPYIAADEYEELPAEISGYEPRLALWGGTNGLAIIKRVIIKARHFLHPNGWLAMEIGAAQGRAVGELMVTNGYKDIRLLKDLAGCERVVLASYANHAGAWQ